MHVTQTEHEILISKILEKVQEAEQTPRDHNADQEIGKVLKHEDDVRNLFWSHAWIKEVD